MANTTNKQTISSSDRFLRFPEVKERVGFSRSMVQLLIKRGEFPAPCKLGLRASGWLESSIDKWIAERVAASRTSV